MNTDNNEISQEESIRWMVARVKPRAEKQVVKNLKGISLPDVTMSKKLLHVDACLIKVKRKWSDRTKLVEVPAIPGYVFVRFDDSLTLRQQADLLVKINYTPGLLRLLQRPGYNRFSLEGIEMVSNREIIIFKELATEIGNPIELSEEEELAKIKVNKTVVFREGVLADMGVEFKVDDMRRNEPTLFIGKGIFQNAHIRVSKASIKAID